MVRLILLLSCLFIAFPAEAKDDRVLYENIVDRVHAGEAYYDAAADELRQGGYPLKPLPAFRPPTLAFALGLLPNRLSRFVLLIALCIAAAIAWMRAFKDTPAWERISTVTLLMSGLANVGASNSLYLHEAWAICFIALSLAFYRSLALCLIFALIAVVIRETAILFAIAMGLVALVTRDWKRASWLILVGLLSAGLWLVHGIAVSAVLLPTDLASQGWIASGGLSMVLAAAKWNILTSELSGMVLTGVVASFLLSFIAVRSVELQVVAVFVTLFCIMLLFVGRPDNDYWGIMFAPFLALGLPSMARLIGGWKRQGKTTFTVPGPESSAIDESTLGERGSSPK